MSLEGKTHIEIVETAPPVFEPEKPGEECGVFGIYAPSEPVAKITHNALHELQHRGQNGAGIFVNGEGGLRGMTGEGQVDTAIPRSIPVLHHETGKVSAIMDDEGTGGIALGHVRYSTNGNAGVSQPIKHGEIALAQNGHVEMLDRVGEIFGMNPDEYRGDGDFITALLEKQMQENGSLEAALLEVLPKLEGAYSLTITDGKRLIGVRDPWAYRPLCLGELPDGKGYALASERVAFEDAAGATFVRDLEQGEIVIIDENGPRSLKMNLGEDRLSCMFEYIYFARPNSVVDGVSVYKARENMGRALAADAPVDVDMVVGVRESGVSAAEGYSLESGIPKREGLFKNPYSVRTFIEDGHKRKTMLQRKQWPNEEILEGARIVLVDDSIIKGNTMAELVEMLRDAGAVEVHVRIAAPLYMYPCYMGMDTRNPDELIARQKSEDEICEAIGADSIAFNSVERVEESILNAARTQAAGERAGMLCQACVTGEYPFEVPCAGAKIKRPERLGRQAVVAARS